MEDAIRQAERVSGRLLSKATVNRDTGRLGVERSDGDHLRSLAGKWRMNHTFFIGERRNPPLQGKAEKGVAVEAPTDPCWKRTWRAGRMATKGVLP
ncbi:hypothetical protein HPP92_020862 [Vanilla planifolia]|uniref:Uncharacterized protein n=1 Tax=Vanilla planifolia TaxID=51239 RepID=A0A835UK61_VANPL|nr:hypothetical protein HPP92_021157 [Vanilla planifolia]KAG0462386.1 hypothetical protein HPP92_020862 [Vanilla planifolia]